MHLYIAYKNYSSWSLRPWLAMKVAGIPFAETLLPFAHGNSLKQFSEQHGLPAQVPVLIVEDLVIWDSLAILEYLAECYPERQLWPESGALRALARSAAAEMHSGFNALRSQFPMNCRTEKAVAPSDAVTQELQRLAEIWARFEQADKPKGPFLAGEFSNVDAMFAPVMWRVRNYGLTVSPAFDRWVQAMYDLPAMQEWLASARAETWQMPSYER
ncbi:glutathione S-transferase family protein [Nitrincola iocasae]|uniref:Glutathione S-transferase family protein n=1 Tax=Nitrincola iocasae TaxID=2614693 RepID=A0A5J6L8U0_9GAMM|nr:glutathione S-transferase family protein [Nitrincola iocasae]QEW05059.1 glutathione S-transferase family protein [Nitrincola iocasae]